ncbi:MAG: TIGR03009 domain-containing protein [Planctomycetia bacterium]|nr:TIGR03009 domain-containing protein [Planctomycetia bacterium]
MTKRIVVSTALALLLAATAATAQEQPWRPSGPQIAPAMQSQPQPSQPAAQPQAPQQPAGQPVQPQIPVGPPFTLTPQQQQYVDQVLLAWQQRSEGIKTLETKFTRRQYDPARLPQGRPKDAPLYEDDGLLKYKKPDKGLFRIDGQQPEQWVCDGMSIYQYDYQKKQLIEHKLPPERQGQAIEDGPLPFLFGASAEKLKRRYWIRAVPPPPGVKDQIWLEAYPRYQQDAADFERADVILGTKDVLPLGIQLHLPNGKSRTSYSFQGMDVNNANPFRKLEGDPFSPRAPLGWTRFVENPPAAQASTEAVGGKR